MGDELEETENNYSHIQSEGNVPGFHCAKQKTMTPARVQSDEMPLAISYEVRNVLVYRGSVSSEDLYLYPKIIACTLCREDARSIPLR